MGQFTPEQDRSARARGFRSAAEAVAWQKNRDQPATKERSLADRIFGSDAVAAASAWHPRVIMDTVSKRFKDATGQD